MRSSGRPLDVGPGDPALLRDPQVLAAQESVLRVTGNACGLGIEGSGWIAAPGYVVTNAHVVAGVEHPYVDHYGGRAWQATVVAFDPSEDLAVLRVPGLARPPSRDGNPEKDTAVVVSGTPATSRCARSTGRLGKTVSTFVRDAYGHFPVARAVTPIRAAIRPGNSGGPAVDADGRVRAVVFARRAGKEGGFGIPVQLVAQLVDDARRGGALRARAPRVI